MQDKILTTTTLFWAAVESGLMQMVKSTNGVNNAHGKIKHISILSVICFPKLADLLNNDTTRGKDLDYAASYYSETPEEQRRIK